MGHPGAPVPLSSSATTNRRCADDMADSAREMFEEAGIEIIEWSGRC